MAIPFNSLFEMHMRERGIHYSVTWDTFNSLFEMPTLAAAYPPLGPAAPFNSLFEMQKLLGLDVPERLSDYIFQFSI